MKFLTLTTLFLGLANAQLAAVPIIRKIAPTVDKCNKAKFKECANAKQAAPWIAKSMAQYEIFDVCIMAAIISNMAFESGDFKYRRNLNVDHHGQGTANQQSPKFNLKYAQSLDGVKDKVKDINWLDIEPPSAANNATKDHILDLVITDQYNFGSGAWFFATECSDKVRAAFREDPDKGFKSFLVDCVDTAWTSDRDEYWVRAKKAFGIKTK